MGHDPDREPPFFFCKPADAVVAARPASGLVLPFPSATANLHFEVEQVRLSAPAEACFC
jgi:fumarylpyruvate hydrolase